MSAPNGETGRLLEAELAELRAAHAYEHAQAPDGEAIDCKPISDRFYAGRRVAAGEADVVTLVIEDADQAAVGYEQSGGRDIDAHITYMWDRLSRPGDFSEIPVPHKIFIPGERFIENYYWDNLEVIRGLAVENRWDDIRGLVENYAVLIERDGYIRNGTRSYYEGRSQQPVFAEMVEILAEHDGPETIARYLGAVKQEYAFWMDGEHTVAEGQVSEHRRVAGVVGASGKRHTVNRYYSDVRGPRPEVICVDDALIARAVERGLDPDQFSLDIRAACESGWDFSSRWQRQPGDLISTVTTRIVPVDLNCNLLKYEQLIAYGERLVGNFDDAAAFDRRAADRVAAIEDIFWNEQAGFYFDYDLDQLRHTDVWSLAGVYPLDAMTAGEPRARRVLAHIRDTFLKEGGCMATLNLTEEQWDGENGWAPLQFRVARAAIRNGDVNLAFRVRHAFMRAVEAIFAEEGKIPEKVNVNHLGRTGNKGEYPPQWGFGWTNGVYRAFQFFTFIKDGYRIYDHAHETMAEAFARRFGWILGALGMADARQLLTEQRAGSAGQYARPASTVNGAVGS